jgi:hypothetical protein
MYLAIHINKIVSGEEKWAMKIWISRL